MSASPTSFQFEVTGTLQTILSPQAMGNRLNALRYELLRNGASSVEPKLVGDELTLTIKIDEDTSLDVAEIRVRNMVPIAVRKTNGSEVKHQQPIYTFEVK